MLAQYNSSWSHCLRSRSPDGPYSSQTPRWDLSASRCGHSTTREQSHLGVFCVIWFTSYMQCFEKHLHVTIDTVFATVNSCFDAITVHSCRAGVASDTSLCRMTFTETCFGLRSPKNNSRATFSMFQEP